MTGSPPTSPPPRTINGPWRWGLLLGLLVLGVGLRLEEFNRPFLSYHSIRECDTASVARYYATESLDPLRPCHNWDIAEKPFRYLAELPLFPFATGLLHRAIGFHERNGRMLNLALAALSILLFFRLVERWNGSRTALAAATLLTLSPLYIYFSSAVTRHGGMEQCCMCGWLLLWDKWATTKKTGWLLLWAPLAGLSLALTPSTAILVPVSLAAATARGRLRDCFRWPVIAAAGGALAIPALWFGWVIFNLGGMPGNMYQQEGNLRAWHDLSYWFRWCDPHWFVTMARMALLAIGTWAGTLLALGGLLLRRRRDWLLPPAVWALAGILYFMADSFVVTGFLHEYYFLLWAPALWWLGGLALNKLAAGAGRWAFPTLLILLLAYSANGLLEGRHRVAGWYRQLPCRWVEAFGWDQRVAKTDLVAFVNLPNGVIYRADRRGWPLTLQPPGDRKKLEHCLGQGAKWVLVGRSKGGATQGLGLQEIFGPEAITEMGLVRVPPPAPIAAIMNSSLTLWMVKKP